MIGRKRYDGFWLVEKDCGCKAWVYPISPEKDVIMVEDLEVIDDCEDHCNGDSDNYGFWVDELSDIEISEVEKSYHG